MIPNAISTADVDQPKTETNSETTIIEKGAAGLATNLKIIPTNFGNYRIVYENGSVPKPLQGLWGSFMEAKRAIKIYFSSNIERSKKLEDFIDPKLKKQLKARKEERSAQSTS